MQSAWRVLAVLCLLNTYVSLSTHRQLITLLEHKNCSHKLEVVQLLRHRFNPLAIFSIVLWNANAFSSAVLGGCVLLFALKYEYFCSKIKLQCAIIHEMFHHGIVLWSGLTETLQFCEHDIRFNRPHFQTPYNLLGRLFFFSGKISIQDASIHSVPSVSGSFQ